MFGLMKTNVKLDRLERTEAPQQNKALTKATTFVSSETQERMYEKKLNFKQDIDVRGMRGDEAIQAVTYFIDDAILVGVSRVRILHGTGTGILRTLIRQYLSGNTWLPSREWLISRTSTYNSEVQALQWST